jgi:hypothetical protein
MRVAAIAVVLVACGGGYDPLDEVAYREYPDTQTAVQAILDEVGPVRVYAVGEYHPTQTVRTTPLARFTRDVMPVLGPHAQHLVVEAWFDASCAGSGGDPVQAQIQQATNRPPQQQTDLAGLVTRSGIATHGLPMTCIEHSAVLDPNGRVDFVQLLALVTEKLYETTHALVEQGRDVIVYGGALHNDLYPRWLLDDLAYGHVLAREVGVVEIDLVVPEVVWPVKALWREPWFPLMARTGPDRVLVWDRGPHSYVVILPAESDAIAKRMTDL